MFEGTIEYFTNCPFEEQTYYEYDTGYSEYGCRLGDMNPEQNPCREEDCPLKCSYKQSD